MSITITEAMAEIKLINAKVDKKKQFILTFLARQDGVKDPLEKQGGSYKSIQSEMQAIADLHQRLVNIRTAINEANAKAVVTVLDKTQTVAQWLVWKRDIAPKLKDLLSSLQSNLASLRKQARQRGENVVGNSSEASSPADIVVNLDEKALADQIEKAQEMTDLLDGKLSLHNATVTVEV